MSIEAYKQKFLQVLKINSFRKKVVISILLFSVFSLTSLIYLYNQHIKVFAFGSTQNTSIVQTTSQTPPDITDLWNGNAHLGPVQTVNFVGNPSTGSFGDPGRVSLIYGNNNEIYAYFRQAVPNTSKIYDLYMATSTDGGMTFNVNPNAILSQQNTGEINLFDPNVMKLNNGYWMVYESQPSTDNCTGSVSIAYSPDGVNNWKFEGIPVCGQSWNLGASTPNFVQVPNSNNLYLQWVVVDYNDVYDGLTTRHQIEMDPTNLTKTLSTDPLINQLPQDIANSWDDRNFGSGNTIYENGYYYTFYEGADSVTCQPTPPHNESLWGIGLARTNDIANPSSVVKYSGNPLIIAQKNDSCWVQYPAVIKINGSYYLYYEDSYNNYGHPNEYILRREIVWNTTSTITGKVVYTQNGGGGLGGVSVNDGTQTVLTNSSGYYTFNVVPGSYTIKIALPEGYNYATNSPTSLSVIATPPGSSIALSPTPNFSLTPIATYPYSGNVYKVTGTTETGMPGVTVINNGVTTTTNSSGEFSFNTPPGLETFTLQLPSGYSYVPNSKTEYTVEFPSNTLNVPVANFYITQTSPVVSQVPPVTQTPQQQQLVSSNSISSTQKTAYVSNSVRIPSESTTVSSPTPTPLSSITTGNVIEATTSFSQVFMSILSSLVSSFTSSIGSTLKL